ncbi:hypothetical protein [Streptomyces sp. NPDC002640]
MTGNRYRFVGPEELRASVRPERRGRAIRGPGDLREPDVGEVFTYVVDLRGLLRLAPRRSEHVVCAGGEPVLAAGEIRFRADGGGGTDRRGGGDGPAVAGGRVVAEVSNLSTGYCPDVTSWQAVAAALDAAGIGRPEGFTDPVVFRWCPSCRQVQIVRDAYFVCVFCDGDLPEEWNADRAAGPQ